MGDKAQVEEQGFIPLYKREAITNVLHEASGFRTDYQFIQSFPKRKATASSTARDKSSAALQYQG